MNIWWFGPIAAVLSLIAPVAYIRSILAGQSKPHRTTHLVLLVSTNLAFVSLLVEGDTGSGVWLAAAQALQTFVTFALSIRYGMGGWSKIDRLCLVIATLGIVVWQTTDEALVGLAAGILADFVGCIPTLIKTWRLPHTESTAYYVLDTTAAGISTLGVASRDASVLAFPVYIFVINAVMVWLTSRKPAISGRF